MNRSEGLPLTGVFLPAPDGGGGRPDLDGRRVPSPRNKKRKSDESRQVWGHQPFRTARMRPSRQDSMTAGDAVQGLSHICRKTPKRSTGFAPAAGPPWKLGVFGSRQAGPRTSQN